MAVLFITHKYPPATGGMEQQSYQLIKGYQNVNNTYSIIFTGQESILLFFVKLRFRVKKILKEHPEINFIHLNDGLMAAFFTLLNVSSNGKKLAVTFHGLDVVFPLALYQKYLLPRVAKKMDVIITVSTATKAACVERHFPTDKIHVISNGVDMPSTKQDFTDIEISGIDFDNDKILLAIGRPVKRKGFSWFAREVMPLLDHRYKFVHVGNIQTKSPFLYSFLPKRLAHIYDLFIGRANDTSALISAAQNVQNRTIVTGKLSDSHRDFLIQKATFLVMPNIKVAGDMEGFGLVALEGASQGKMVLASDIEGITDAIQDQKTGYLVPSENPTAWATLIQNYTIKTKDENSFKDYTLKHYSWQKMVDAYAKIFSRP